MTRQHATRMKLGALLALIFTAASVFAAQKNYDVTGLLLAADRSRHTITVSCKEIPGYMEAMVMSLPVADSTLPDGLRPGKTVEFRLIVDSNSSFARDVHVQPFESLELDPTEARRLKLMEDATHTGKPDADVIAVGDTVPDFHLTDQDRRPVSLSELAGKVVALTFIYTRCPLPDYCVRLSNNFGLLQKRFKDRLGHDLVLLTVVIDPVHDQPDALISYAQTWKADSHSWHFLTGSAAEVQRLSRGFDMHYYPDEALFVHSFNTIVIDRRGRLAANIEGNNFTAQQLGDLVNVTIERTD